MRAYREITSPNQTVVSVTSSVPSAASAILLTGIVCGAIAVGAALAIVIVVLIGCLVITIHRKRSRDLIQVGLFFCVSFPPGHGRKEKVISLALFHQAIDPQSIESVSRERESVAIQHGTPTIDKLTRRAQQKQQQRMSSLAALASSRLIHMFISNCHVI